MKKLKEAAEVNLNSNNFYNENRAKSPDEILYFFELNKSFPSHRYFANIKIENLVDTIKKKFSITENNIVTIQNYNKVRGITTRNILFIVEEDLFISGYSWGGDEEFDMKIYYCDKTNKNLLKKVTDFLGEHQIIISDSEIGVIGEGQNGFFIRFFKVNVPNMDIEKYYNDDFLDIHQKVVERLNGTNKGVVLFHGKAGTGKTSYIRHLSSIIKKRLIFVPQEIAAKVASPTFITLLMDYPNSILIMEDAENVIKDRDISTSSPVANILNISDGLLSDCLNLQVICTFNTSITSIDKALLRKGRIIANYEFKPLSSAKANILSSLNGFSAKFDKDATLADIFNNEDDNFEMKPRTKIGFDLSIPLVSDNPCDDIKEIKVGILGDNPFTHSK